MIIQEQSLSDGKKILTSNAIIKILSYCKKYGVNNKILIIITIYIIKYIFNIVGITHT